MRWTALIVVLAVMLGCGSRDEDKTWRFAIEENAGSVQDAYAQKFAQLIEEKSGGEVKVIVYPYGALGTSDHTTEQLYDRTIQFVMASPGHLGKLIPEVQVFLLHFVLSGDADIDNEALADPKLRASFDRLYAEKHFKLLTFFTEGEMVWTTNKKITKPSDFAGVKMRVMTTPLLIAAYEAYGASPTPLSYFEVYSGLQLKMIDGQVNPIFAIEEMKFYEVTSVLTFPGHAQFVSSMMTNADFYKSLPPRKQRWIKEAVDELQPYILGVQKKYNAERLQKIIDAKKKRGKPLEIVRFTEAQRAPFRKKAQSVIHKFVSEGGDDAKMVLDQLQAAVKRARAAHSHAAH